MIIASKGVIINMDQIEAIICEERSPGVYGVYAISSGRQYLIERYKQMEGAENAIKKMIETYKDRIPDKNTVFYMP